MATENTQKSNSPTCQRTRFSPVCHSRSFFSPKPTFLMQPLFYLQALFLEAYRERCAFKLGDEITMQMWIGKKKTDFFEKSGGKVCIFHIICRIFASLKQNGALVQLVRMPACHAGGRWFESCTHRKRSNEPTKASCFSLF